MGTKEAVPFLKSCHECGDVHERRTMWFCDLCRLWFCRVCGMNWHWMNCPKNPKAAPTPASPEAPR